MVIKKFVAALTAVLFLVSTACSSDDPAPKAAARPTTPAPSSTPSDATGAGTSASGGLVVGVALHGKQRTGVFHPGFTFKAPESPFPFFADTEEEGFIALPSGDFDVLFIARLDRMYGPDGKLAKLPSDIVSWAEANENLDVIDSSTVSVGGIDTKRVIVDVKSTLDTSCNAPCTPVFDNPDAPETIGFGKGERVGLILVPHPDGSVLITYVAKKSDFATFGPFAEKLIDSIKFR